jgi:hypothetical protein
MSRNVRIVGFFAFLLAVDWFLYFRHAGHFFQGDTIFLIDHRAVSIAQYFKGFIKLNPSGWYRPLAFELFESLLYTFAGLHPIPYRIPVYVAFVAVSIIVYALAFALSRRHLTAAVASFFFSIHMTGAYATYDLAFLPELFYSFFYVAAVLAYFRYVVHGSKWAYWLSLAAGICSLLSKEAAVTFPAALILIGILFSPRKESFRKCCVRTIRTTAPHVMVVMTYLCLVVGYLGVQNFSIRRMFDRSHVVQKSEYVPVFRIGILKNADFAATWAFNIGRGEWFTWQDQIGSATTYAKVFRAVVLGLFLVIVVVRHRESLSLILFGLSWFWLTLAPALPLVAHFIPYYLFLPVVGFSLALGAAFAWLYDWARRIQPALAASIIGIVMIAGFVVASITADAEIRNDPLLGKASSLAKDTLDDLMRFHPMLPENVTIYFADAGQPVGWHHDWGGLIRMAYNAQIPVFYQSAGNIVPPEAPNTLVFAVRGGHLIDTTTQYRQDPTSIMKFIPSPYQLEVSPADVTAGRGRYTLRIKGLKNKSAKIGYRINDGPFETFVANLDDKGRVVFDVSSDIRRGTYKFLAFNIPGTTDWMRADSILRIH